MTPRFWHSIVNRVKPFKRKLVFGAAVGFIATAVFFSTAAFYQDPNKWLFLSLWLSTVLLFWCLGLLLVIRLYGELPAKSVGILGGFNYYWNLIVGWYGAIFLTVWFLGLAFATVVVPLKMVFANAR